MALVIHIVLGLDDVLREHRAVGLIGRLGRLPVRALMIAQPPLVPTQALCNALLRQFERDDGVVRGRMAIEVDPTSHMHRDIRAVERRPIAGETHRWRG